MPRLLLQGEPNHKSGCRHAFLADWVLHFKNPSTINAKARDQVDSSSSVGISCALDDHPWGVRSPYYIYYFDILARLTSVRLFQHVSQICRKMVRFHLVLSLAFVAAVQSVAINVTALTQEVESDWSAVYYPSGADASLLIGNDGEASSGGFHVWSLSATTPLSEVEAVTPGRRTKLVSTVYALNGKDYAVTIGQPDSILRLFELPDVAEVANGTFAAIGDWSALCAWRSNARNQYLYLFGKNQAIQFLIRDTGNGPEILEVGEFESGNRLDSYIKFHRYKHSKHQSRRQLVRLRRLRAPCSSLAMIARTFLRFPLPNQPRAPIFPKWAKRKTTLRESPRTSPRLLIMSSLPKVISLGYMIRPHLLV